MAAVDIVRANQSLLEQLSTVKISSYPIGKTITSLLSHVNPRLESGSILTPSFIRMFAQDRFIMLGFEYELQIWSFSNSGTELKMKHCCNNVIIESTMFDNGSSFNVAYLSAHDDVDSYCLRLVSFDTNTENSLVGLKTFQGSATCILSSQNSLVIGHTDGSFRIVNSSKMEVVGEIEGYIPRAKMHSHSSGYSRLCDTSCRWIALEVGWKDDGWWERSAGANSNDFRHGSETNPGDLMRKAVSGMYTVGKFSWESVEPYLDQALKGQQGENCANSKADKRRQKSHTTAARRPSLGNDSNANMSTERGGGVVIYDIGSDRKVSLCHEMLKFSAHSTALSAIKFSPSGSKIATADDDGQVVHIHSLIMGEKECGQSSLSVSLLYKLVRGITLVRVVDIQFNEFEDCCLVSTVRGTIHVFDLVGGSAAFIRYPLPVAQPPVSAVIDGTSQVVTKMGANVNPPPQCTSDSTGIYLDTSRPAQATMVNIDKVVRNNIDAKSIKIVPEIPSDLRIRCPERSFKTSFTSIREKQEFDELHALNHTVHDNASFDSPFENSSAAGTPDTSLLSSSQFGDLSPVYSSSTTDVSGLTESPPPVDVSTREEPNATCTVKTLLFNNVNKTDNVGSYEACLLPMEYVVVFVTPQGLLCRQHFRRILSNSIGKSFMLEGLAETNRWDLLLDKHSEPYANIQLQHSNCYQENCSIYSAPEQHNAARSTSSPTRNTSTAPSDTPSSVHNRNMKRAAWLTSACSSSCAHEASGINNSSGFDIIPLWQRHQIQWSLRNDNSDDEERQQVSSILYSDKLPKKSFFCTADVGDGQLSRQGLHSGQIQNRMSSVLGSGVGNGSLLHPSDSVDAANEAQRALFRKRNDEYKANRARQDDIGIWELDAEWEYHA